jgi:hypothetical protein
MGTWSGHCLSSPFNQLPDLMTVIDSYSLYNRGYVVTFIKDETSILLGHGEAKTVSGVHLGWRHLTVYTIV